MGRDRDFPSDLPTKFELVHHVHFHGDVEVSRRLERIEHSIHQLTQEIHNMTAELTKFIAAVDAATDKIAARIQKLIDASSLNDADRATLQAEVDKLNLLGQDPANPIPPAVSA